MEQRLDATYLKHDLVDRAAATALVAAGLGVGVGDRLNSQTAAVEVIKREVTYFSYVQHGQGTVVTGWSYKDGRGGTPVSQFCYYTSRNPDQSSKRVDLAANGARLPQISLEIVPDLEGALSKCQWWPGSRESER
jgi:hypothetical protein